MDICHILLGNLCILRKREHLVLCIQDAAHRLVKALVGNHAVFVILNHGFMAKLSLAPYEGKVVTAGNGQPPCALLAVLRHDAAHREGIGDRNAVKAKLADDAEHLRREGGGVLGVDIHVALMLYHNGI